MIPDCLILGDSLAVGVGQARPGCTTAAKVGITSGTFIQTLLPTAPGRARSIVISLGVNDDPSMATLDNLRLLRRRIAAPTVTWLLPGLKEDVRRAIRQVAAENRDRTVDTRSQVGPDHLHPGTDGYRLIAGWTLAPGIGQGPAAKSTGPNLSGLTPPGARVIAMQQPNWPPAPHPGSAFTNWPPTGAPFAAIPPSAWTFRALPSPIAHPR